MPPLAYALVLLGGLLIRQVVVGRAADTPGDLRDLFLGFAQGDMDSVQEVFARRGENVSAGLTGSQSSGNSLYTGGNDLAVEMQKLGSAANGYRLGSTGPEYFDCSGLVWKAMSNLGMYAGSRFTTYTFQSVASREGWTQLEAAVEGCVILWTNEHMGVSLGGDIMYSARSTKKGIGQSTISGDSSYFGKSPIFFKVA